VGDLRELSNALGLSPISQSGSSLSDAAWGWEISKSETNASGNRILTSMRTALALILTLLATTGLCQGSPAKAEDVKSIDAIVAALYDVISGPPGAKHDWDRMRSLFAADAKMIAVGKTRAGAIRNRAFSVEDYVKLSGPIIEKGGFVEKELARKTDQFANIAHVFSTYESKIKKDDAKPFERGINSLQLWNDGTRWWIVSIQWQNEDSSNPLPKQYLPGA
jgi:hypothetical protein